MNLELFPVADVACESPKLRWLRIHGLETEHLADGGTECPETGDIIPHWVCRLAYPKGRKYWGDHAISGGDTEDEACSELAYKRGLKLWNEGAP